MYGRAQGRLMARPDPAKPGGSPRFVLCSETGLWRRGPGGPPDVLATEPPRVGPASGPPAPATNGAPMHSNGNSFASGKTTERQASLWAWLLGAAPR